MSSQLAFLGLNLRDTLAGRKDKDVVYEGAFAQNEVHPFMSGHYMSGLRAWLFWMMFPHAVSL